MARSRGGGRVPPDDLLSGLTPDAPEAATRPAAPRKRRKAPHPQTPPEVAAELQRIAARLDALVKQYEALSAGAEADATAALGELRGVVEAAAQGMRQTREEVRARLAAIEAAVAELPAAPRAAGDIVEQMKLARSALVGLSERMEGLERRVPETLEAIERAATAKTLDAAARGNAQALPKVTRIEGTVEALRRYAFAWSLVTGIVVIGCIVLDTAARFGLIPRLGAIW